MWKGGGCPPAVVATSAAAARSLRLQPAGFHPPPPRRRAAAIKGVNCLLFRSPFFKGPWEGVHLCSPRGRRSSLASSRGRDGRAPRRLWARCTAATLGGGSLLWWRDAGAAALVMGGAYALVLCFDVLTQRGLIDQKLSRKIVHVLSGILFMTSWPLFSSSIEARFFAALVPFVNCFRLTIYGLSLVTDEGLIKSVAREGKPEYCRHNGEEVWGSEASIQQSEELGRKHLHVYLWFLCRNGDALLLLITGVLRLGLAGICEEGRAGFSGGYSGGISSHR